MNTDKIHPPCVALIDWRLGRGLTQQQAADFIGVTKNQITKWENGRALPRYRALQRIAAKTGLDANTIVNVVVNPKPAGLRSSAESSPTENQRRRYGTDKHCYSYSLNPIQRRLPRELRPARGRHIPAAVRLDALTRKTPTCWIFEGTILKSGYGQIMLDGKTKARTSTHRLAYELAHGPIPKGMVVCHRCDVPACVNPDHLYLATQAENIRDAHRKGRYTAWHRTGKRLNGQPAKV